VFARFPFALALLLGSAACLAAASNYVDIEQRLTPEQRRATGLDTLTPAQLELLNRLLREQEPAPQAAPASTKSDKPNDESSLIGFNDAEIASRLVNTITGWEPGYVFELENGQKWKVLKGAVKLRQPLDRPKVKVIPGIAGRWFMEVTDDMPKARVYRID